MYALVDCNAFFVSCERLFEPRLARRPVVVLSSNDGCAVSRSDEAKDLGVPMGAPHFEFRELERTHGLVCLSSNFELYADLSRRVMSLFDRWSPEVEVYSIDEAFLGLHHVAPENLHAVAADIRATVERWTGIPVSVGVARTKTLAKAANDVAKKDARAGRDRSGVRVLAPGHETALLAGLAAGDIWGIGRKLVRKLEPLGVRTALELRDAPEARIRAALGVTVERTVRELRGTPCLGLDTNPAPQRNMAHMRSFAKPVTDREAVRAAVRHHAERAAANLRREKLAARAVGVHLSIAARGAGRWGESLWKVLPLPVPSDLTPELSARALDCFDAMFLPGHRYKKAGILYLDLVPAEETQSDLFDAVDRPRAANLMKALDRVQSRHGSSLLRYGWETEAGDPRRWNARADRRTPRFTTRWEEIRDVE